jgi:hypothetical protein
MDPARSAWLDGVARDAAVAYVRVGYNPAQAAAMGVQLASLLRRELDAVGVGVPARPEPDGLTRASPDAAPPVS